MEFKHENEITKRRSYPVSQLMTVTDARVIPFRPAWLDGEEGLPTALVDWLQPYNDEVAKPQALIGVRWLNGKPYPFRIQLHSSQKGWFRAIFEMADDHFVEVVPGRIQYGCTRPDKIHRSYLSYTKANGEIVWQMDREEKTTRYRSFMDAPTIAAFTYQQLDNFMYHGAQVKDVKLSTFVHEQALLRQAKYQDLGDDKLLFRPPGSPAFAKNPTPPLLREIYYQVASRIGDMTLSKPNPIMVDVFKDLIRQIFDHHYPLDSAGS